LAEHHKEHVRMDSRGYKGTYIRRKYDHSTNLQNQIWITLDMSVQTIKYLDWSTSNIQVDYILLTRIKFLLQLKFHSQRSFENLFAWKRQSKTRDAGGEELWSSILTSFRDTATRSNGFKVIRTRARPISARVASMGDLLCPFTGAPPSGRELTETTQRLCPYETQVFWWDADAWWFCCDGCFAMG